MRHLYEHAARLKDWIVVHRRALHAAPELSGAEEKTAAHCAAALRELGWTVTRRAGHGFSADLAPVAASDRQAVALRAELDALPVAEATGLPFASRVLGVAHACGHDAHMAALLGAARIVAERRAELTRSVRLLFQPSEECFPGGAPAMIEAGCLEGVAEVYGLHNAPDLAAGVVVVGRGPVMAACDNVRLTLVGRGCHGATPQLGLDPIAAGARVVREWRELALARIAELRARTGERGAEEPGSGKPESAAPETGAPGAAFAPVVSICTFHAGDKENVYPERAHLSGTVRTLEAAERAAVEGALRELLAGLEAEGYGFELDYEHSYPAVVNHPEAARRVVRLAAAVLGAQRVGPMAASRAWAEDFSYYLLERPGAYFFLGGGSPDPAPGEPLRGAGEPLHSPRHAFDEAALPAGAAVLAALALAP